MADAADGSAVPLAPAALADVRPEGSPWPLRLPADADAEQVRAAGTLAVLAAGAYDASLDALAAGDVPRALEHAEEALRWMPFAEPLLDYAAALATAHGDLGLAHRVLGTAAALGLDDLSARYAAPLAAAAERWNADLADPGRIAARLDVGEPASYREMLLLAEAPAVPRSAAAVAQMRAVGLAAPDAPAETPALLAPAVAARALAPRRTMWPLMLAGLAAVAVAGAAGFTFGKTRVPVVKPVAVTIPTGGRSAADSLRADSATAPAETPIAVQGVTPNTPADSSAVRHPGALAAWRRNDFAGVVAALAPAGALVPEEQYPLCVSAEKVGRAEVARAACEAYLATPASRESKPYRVQAAYSAARLADAARDSTAAAEAARIIRDEFPRHPNNNSLIRRLSGHGR